MKLINAVPILYYELNVPPERVREAFPSALEFKNPTPESFSIVQPPGKNAGLLVIDVKGENRYVFVLPVKDELILINETLPRVFVISPAGLDEFFKALVEDNIEGILDKGIERKGKKWRFLIDFVATFIVVSIENQLHIGLWSAVLLGAVFTTVEYLFGPRKAKFRVMATELSEKSVRRMYEVSEKNGKVVKVFL
ncbi:hypothetical protein [Thermococcus sp. 21S9]|uniref:hypothetical protein n=1 Tax=Thermococcus sp. 21S9 TaxID=1638223 RepID=UPI001439B928|nr:hypothetical protein [Thermococcus sp. 21S9]NJE55171.1 hypothetical protein [Thermococcus sp. 21S9]